MGDIRFPITDLERERMNGGERAAVEHALWSSALSVKVNSATHLQFASEFSTQDV
jgi:hypothetical protein